jgi:glycosyltransferase involved in cell wall biosynthesis
VIVGGGRERRALEDLARDRGVADVTRFVGPVPHASVPHWLHALDVYVAASRSDSESFGVAVLEASACGLPVIVSDVGGLPEVVDDGVTGRIVPKEEPAALAAAILELALNRALRERMGRAGVERVRRGYDWSVSVREMEQVYQETLECC